MAGTGKSADDVCRRFNSVEWHDSKIIELRIVRRHVTQTDDVDDVVLNLKLLTHRKPGDYYWQNAELSFRECTILKLDLDLDGKRVCADSIAAAICHSQSPLKQKIEEEKLAFEGEGPLADYLHFHIQLIHPGGDIHVFARNFELTMA